jgi:hypothetical protein
MKTAVEWLYDQIENEGKCIYEVMEQAKEMEKEQMINYHKHLIEKFTKLEYTFNTDAKLILENYKNTEQ